MSEVNIELCQMVCRSVADRSKRCIDHEKEYFEHVKSLVNHK